MTNIAAPSNTRRPRGLLLWTVTAWAVFATLLIGLLSRDIRGDEFGADRDSFDIYFENALSGTRDLKQTVTGLQPDMNIVAACFWSTRGIERFLGEKARAALEADGYYQAYRMADYVWRLLLISDDQRFRAVVMVQYDEPGEDRSQHGCHALADIRTIVIPPSIQDGKPKSGRIRLESAGGAS